MGISLRDEKGQGIVEYVLVLVVAVSIILGGIYQLNSAFKVWANNYFGNYLACLLETGELPTISGNPGDSGICNQLFKPFSLADGRPLRERGEAPESKPSQRATASQREGGGGGYSGGVYQPTPFRASNRQASLNNRGGGRGGKKQDSTYTGSTAAGGYGSSYSAQNKKLNTGVKTRLDTRFAFDDSREREGRKPFSVNLAKSSEAGGKKNAIRLRQHAAKKDVADGPSSGFSIANFIRFLIIAAIVIAIVMFLGGQALQIGKGMDGGG